MFLRSGTLAEFLQVALVELLMTHPAFSSAVRQKAFISFYYEIFHCMDMVR